MEECNLDKKLEGYFELSFIIAKVGISDTKLGDYFMYFS